MKLKQSLVTIAISLVFVFFVGYGIEVFHNSPVYNEYCPTDLYDIRDEAECTAEGGTWRESDGNRPVPEKGFCGESKECRDAYQESRTSSDRTVFIVAVLAGVIGIVLGIWLQHETVTNGLTGGGVLSILYGTIRYWEHADELLKFVLLGLVLGFLIWVGYKKLK